jgi:glycerol-3-phosphate acyltransferase PlsX
MSDKVRIALDAMGGDQGPAVVVAGADLALKRHPETEFLFFGNAALIAPLLDARPALKAASKLIHNHRCGSPSTQSRKATPTSRCRAAIPAR